MLEQLIFADTNQTQVLRMVKIMIQALLASKKIKSDSSNVPGMLCFTVNYSFQIKLRQSWLESKHS